VKDRQTEDRPTTVPLEAKLAGDIRSRWPWVEPNVWTERMLTAPENGVKGGKWYSLMNAFFAEHRLFFLTTAYRLAGQSARR
jgi:RNA-directed DNA polymerase